MNIQPDFQELLKLLEKNNLRYMVVGGYAVAYHGYPRFTQDLDIFFNISDTDIEKLYNALLEFGISAKEISKKVFFEKGNIIRFGVPPVRIDLINEIDGINFLQAEKNVIRGKYGAIEINFIGKDDLIKNKLATGRLKDRADAEELK